MDKTDIDQIVESYLKHCRYEKGLDEKTLKAYKIDILQFVDYIDKIEGSYSKVHLQAYIASMHNRYAVRSVKRKVASLKALFNYLEFEEILNSNPFSKMRIKLHEPFLLPRTIPLSQLTHCFTVHMVNYLRKRKTHSNIRLNYGMLQFSSCFLLLEYGYQNYAPYIPAMWT